MGRRMSISHSRKESKCLVCGETVHSADLITLVRHSNEHICPPKEPAQTEIAAVSK